MFSAIQFALIVSLAYALGTPVENEEISLFSAAFPPPVGAVLTGAEACAASPGVTTKKYCNRPPNEKCQANGYFVRNFRTYLLTS